ncbi:M67 family metallopeptidase [Paremcibacter congregatus]|uniref:M67 family metallopeptidase n=1 Tax=Paremcibacter congregatus TaxID=2043170 RepID=UPI0030EB2D54|tara:strand:+ start:501 stop:929 length:429 start_codon:yes stop_codon:yes gene_type:complete
MMQLILSDKLMTQICHHVVADYPREACGLLIGLRDGGDEGQVTGVVPSPNMAADPHVSFEIDPALILKYHKQLRDKDDIILGHYHSHPEGLARPSDRDRQQNYDPAMVWVIVQVSKGHIGGVKAFLAPETQADFDVVPIVLF